MSTINKPNTFSPNTTASSSEVNDNFDTIYNEFNGSISAANLASNSVTTVKIADSNVTTAKIADSNVTTAKINDDAVTAAKLDWASTGANGGIWWEELGRTTLGVAGDTISITSFTAKKYIRVIAFGVNTGGTIDIVIRFNNDTGNNYSRRSSNNGGADTTSTSINGISSALSAVACPMYVTADIINFQAQEKLFSGTWMQQGTAGAANTISRVESTHKWSNTTNQITRIDVTNTGTGDFAIGSEVIVLGHD